MLRRNIVGIPSRCRRDAWFIREWDGGIVTLTLADRPEVPVAKDPALALRSASQDNLLTYHGFVQPDGYVVAVGGRKLTLSASEVQATVCRVRAIARVGHALGVEDRARVIELREDGTYVVRFGHVARHVELAEDAVVDWCEGFIAAHAGRDEEHAGVDTIEAIAELFERPNLNDQCRMVILGLMSQPPLGDGKRLTMVRFAEMVGEVRERAGRRAPAKKTVVDALAFGSFFSSQLREDMIAVFGMRWSLSGATELAVPLAEGVPAVPLPEAPALAALRGIVAAARRGWLRYVDEAAPNDARWKRRFKVSLGARTYTLEVGQVQAWLDGVSFFHGN